ncbi:MAG: 2-C-methyl-D-erythritol 4-phosphate cytidylyltransferase [Eubacteriales bacterium]
MFKIFSKVAKAVGNSRIGYVSAVVLCAGNSTRFKNGSENKQMASVLGKPVIVRTLEAFEDCEPIKEVVLVVGKSDIDKYRELVIENGFKKVKSIVTGGNTRQSSAMRGFRHISEKARYVAIHDGARCLVTPSIIEKVLDDAVAYGVASASCIVTDTVKKTDAKGFVSRTLNREKIRCVQTPQIFQKDIYTSCAYKAKERGIVATDDCMLAEAFGFRVKLTDTGRENIKITVSDDISLAEYILHKRGEKEQ